MSERAGSSVRREFPDLVVDTHDDHGDDTITVKREGLLQVLEYLRDDPVLDFKMPLDVTCVDRKGLGEPQKGGNDPMHPRLTTHTEQRLGDSAGPRFEVVYHIRSVTRGALVRVKALVEEDDAVLPSATGLFKGFDWFERETFDMFGVRFEGHHNMKRILLYPEFEGHPLRKDYPRKGYQPRIDMPDIGGDRVPGSEE